MDDLDDPYVPSDYYNEDSDYDEAGLPKNRPNPREAIGKICIFFDAVFLGSFLEKDLFLQALHRLVEGNGGVYNLGYMGLGFEERTKISKLIVNCILKIEKKQGSYDALMQKAIHRHKMFSGQPSENEIATIVNENADKYRGRIREALLKEIRNRNSPLSKIINLDRGFGFSLFGSMEFFSSDTRAYQDLLYAIEQSKSTPSNSTSSRTGLRK